MVSKFDAQIDRIDNVHMKEFGETVIIDGVETTAVYDHFFAEVDGVDIEHRFIEMPKTNLPPGVVEDDSTVKIVSTGETFTVYRIEPDGKQVLIRLT